MTKNINKMKKYTLQEIAEIINLRHYITYDRFAYYLTSRYQVSKNQIDELYKVFLKLPYNITHHEHDANIGYLLPKVLEIYKTMQDSWNKKPMNIRHSDEEKLKKKVIYFYSANKTEKNKLDKKHIKQLVVNFYDAAEVINYAEILKQDIEVIALLAFNSEIRKSKNSDYKDRIDIFEGDVFSTHKDFWNAEGRVYVAEKSGFSELDYIRGKGYLKNGKLNYSNEDERGRFSNYAVEGKDSWNFLCNIYVNTSILIDK